MVNVVDALAPIELDGVAVTEKSLAFAPDIATNGLPPVNDKAAEPVF
jgi:hypothetical protein